MYPALVGHIGESAMQEIRPSCAFLSCAASSRHILCGQSRRTAALQSIGAAWWYAGCQHARQRRCARWSASRRHLCTDTRAACASLDQPAAKPRWWRRPNFRSSYDADILNLAVPALFAIVLDPVMSLVDSGKPVFSARLPFRCNASSARPFAVQLDKHSLFSST